MHDPFPNSNAILSFLNILLYGKFSKLQINSKKIMKLIQKKSNVLLILFTKNNIICTLTTLSGKVISWVTAGSLKIKGSKKITSTTIISLIKQLFNYNKMLGYTHTHVKLKGINKNKSFFIKHVKIMGFNIVSLQEKIILPYNGCKIPSNRRI